MLSNIDAAIGDSTLVGTNHLAGEGNGDNGTQANNNAMDTVTTKTQRKGANAKAKNAPTKPSKVTPIQHEKMDSTTLGAVSSHLSTTIGSGDSLFVQRFSNSKHPRIFCKDESIKTAVTDQLNAASIRYNT